MAYLGVLVPTISVLVEKLQSSKQQLQYCGPLVEAIISRVNRRFSYLSGKIYLLSAASHHMFHLSYIHPELAVSMESENEGDEITAYFAWSQDNALDEVESFQQSTTPDSAFKHLPKIKQVFIQCNTGVPASAAHTVSGCLVLEKPFFCQNATAFLTSILRNFSCRINKHFCSSFMNGI